MAHTTKHYLDTSAFLRLWPPLKPPFSGTPPKFSTRELLRIRRRLVSSMFVRRPRIVIGIPLLDEIAATHESDDPRAVARLSDQIEFLKKCHPLASLGFTDSVRAEIDGTSPWATSKELNAALDVVDNGGDFIIGVREQFKDHREKWYKDIKGVQARFLADAAKRADLHRLGKDLEQNLPNEVQDFCQQLLRMTVRDCGLPPDEEKWPDPRSIPSLWAFAGYHETRTCLVLQRGWKPDPNDSADGQHYICAAHADILVSCDDRFLDIARTCPPPRPKPMHFEEWAREILSDE